MRGRLDVAVAALAVGTAALAVGLALVAPTPAGPLPRGFLTPVLVLELATGPDALLAVLGDPSDPGTAARVLGWTRSHALDLGFMVLYSGLVAGSALKLGGRVAVGVVPLAVVVWAADLVETLVLLDLTTTWGILDAPAGRWVVLGAATWTKWIGLGVALAAIGWHLAGRARFLLALPLPLAVAAWVHPPFVAEGMGLAVLVAFAVLVMRALR